MNTFAHKADPTSPSDIGPWDSGWLDVGCGHKIYHEQCGNPSGVPVVVLHGGPGSGSSARLRQLLDAGDYRMVLFDQRGCGRSTPRGECADNTTADLVSDIECLRRHLGIERWLVCGGSWGAALGVAYCAQHRASCLGAILRGVFLTGRGDIDWFFNGAALERPTAWRRFVAIVPERLRSAPASWYFDAVAGDDRMLALEAVSRWIEWEAALTSPTDRTADSPMTSPSESVDSIAAGAAEQQARLDKYRVQAHYLRNECFLGEAAVLRLAATIHGLPVAILHGRRDTICRPSNAEKLAHALAGAQLRFIEDAGHSPFDATMAEALFDAGRHFLANGDFAGWQQA